MKLPKKVTKRKVPAAAIGAAGAVVGAVAAGLAAWRGPELLQKGATRVATAMEKRGGG